MYRLTFRPAARRQLEKLAERLTTDPRPHRVKKLSGKRDFYRVRVGAYRIIYVIDDRNEEIIVTKIARRTTTTYRSE